VIYLNFKFHGFFQVDALRKVRMFDILCLNTNINSLQQKAFIVAALNGNPLVSCQVPILLNCFYLSLMKSLTLDKLKLTG